MEQRFSVVTLGVADLGRARRFYEEGLGWRRGNDYAEVAFFQAGGSILALYPRHLLAEDAGVANDGQGFDGITLAYCTRTREEVDAVLAQATTAGAKIIKPAQVTFWGGYSGYFADPDGHAWEIAWNPDWTIEADSSVSLRRKG
jgi:catechol 2,3-dioxygenase-like lactoylglutathione lyase family enzyme